MKIFITGLAGMIGFHLAKHVSKLGWKVIGLDNFNDYYDINLKRDREKLLKTEFGVQIIDADIRNIHSYEKEIKDCDLLIHLAAYANPRHSLAEPQHYIDTNITGTQRVVELIEKLQPIIRMDRYNLKIFILYLVVEMQSNIGIFIKNFR